MEENDVLVPPEEEVMPVLQKVTLEYDTHVQTLEGDIARSWLKSVDGMVMLGYAHGVLLPDFNWQKTSKVKENV